MLIKKHNDYIASLNVTDWESSRSVGIGGSDVGIILGHSEFSTPFRLWNDKKGNKTFTGNNLTHWGHNLEEAVAKEFSDVMGLKVRVKSKQYKHKKFPWLLGYVDRLCLKDNKVYAILECKTSSNPSAFGFGYIHRNGKSYDGILNDKSIPVTYYDQVQHYMYISNIHKCYLAVLINGTDFRVYEVPYNEEYAKNNAKECTKFWFGYVVDNVAPTKTVKDFQEFTSERTIKQYIATAEETKELDNTIIRYQEVENKIKSLNKTKDDLKVKLLNLLPEDTQELVDCLGTVRLTFKGATKTRFDTKKFKEIHPRAYEKYSVTSTDAPTLRIKE